MPHYTALDHLPRHREYRADLTRTDYFVLLHLREFIDRTLHQHIPQHPSVIDVGCGEQPWRALIEACGGHYTGVDVVANRARSLHALASTTHLPFTAGQFDLVLCTEVLEHVADSQAALLELARLLRPGGVLLITVPFLYPLHEEPFDFARFTPYRLASMAEQAGLHVVHLELAGNEIEVLATIWSNLWSRLALKWRVAWLAKLLRRALITSGNVPAAVISRLIHTWLPHKAGLSVMCVLTNL